MLTKSVIISNFNTLEPNIIILTCIILFDILVSKCGYKIELLK